MIGFLNRFFRTHSTHSTRLPEEPVECPNCRGRLVFRDGEYRCDGFYSKRDVEERLAVHWTPQMKRAILSSLPDGEREFRALRRRCTQECLQQYSRDPSFRCGHGTYGPCGFHGRVEDYGTLWR